jgi:DNA-binding MarR family transcriptional regulator
MTMPGFTPISMYPKMWLQAGLTYSGLIDRLAALDMVTRVSHPSDRRIKLVELTSIGHTVFADERTFYASLLQLTIETLGDESASAVLSALAMLDLETPE